MARRNPAHHFRRGNIFYFRQVIPADLREHFPTRELCFSLGTEQSQTARHKAIELSAIMQPLFTQLREACMTKEKIPPAVLAAIRAAERIKVRQIYEEREKARLDRTIAIRKKERAQHTAALEQNQKAHAAIVAAMATQHAQTAVELAMRAVAPVAHTTTAATPAPSMMLSEAIEYACKVSTHQNKWTEKTEKENRAIYAMMLRIIGDIPAASVDYGVAMNFISTLRRIPSNINKGKGSKEVSIDEAIAMGKDPISQSTVKKYITRANGLFSLLKHENHTKKTGVTANPFAGESAHINSKNNKLNAKPVEREAFTKGELISLLSHKTFKSRTFNNPYAYWAIPLAMFTGARQNEIAQLHLSDFVEVDGVKCVDINDEDQAEGEEGKRLKTDNARRLVPLHSELLRLGLWGYVGALRAAGYTRLFPEINERRDGYGQTVSNWFQRHRKACGITAKQSKVFHSFRHTVITHLLDKETAPDFVAPLVGHETGRFKTTTKIYWGKKDASARKRIIDRLEYPAEVLALIPTICEVKLDTYGHGTFWVNDKLTDKNIAPK